MFLLSLSLIAASASAHANVNNHSSVSYCTRFAIWTGYEKKANVIDAMKAYAGDLQNVISYTDPKSTASLALKKQIVGTIVEGMNHTMAADTKYVPNFCMDDYSDEITAVVQANQNGDLKSINADAKKASLEIAQAIQGLQE